ncbi:DNA-binding protein [Paucilactobacillus hokkaidonensis JCM 18461]|uniref:DNA-binding protein n=2 Tax=Paucilactobacillus hokkaidonensis TaxID=1193095 RepID=A0A0A1GX30_9LACO|nr:YceD family protein [Paucilactobacillus hokkaidonensis]KRO09220.1 hypothetical protein IV59_GL000782 [Paucilactobacillus hokkaidonensis]BAP85449.1 DNA-binding protein [Paucilactobacillus hokkaidonensis JCM 18461]
MKWSLNELQQYQDEPLSLNSTIDLNASLTERFPDLILAVAPVNVTGYLSYEKGDVMVTATVKTDLTLPSTRSLTPVKFPTQFTFTEYYLEDESHIERYENDETVIVLDDDRKIDFDEAVAENIVLELPMRVLSKEEQQQGAPLPTGSGWEVVSEEDYVANGTKHDSVDPRLAKLKELLPDQDDNNN